MIVLPVVIAKFVEMPILQIEKISRFKSHLKSLIHWFVLNLCATRILDFVYWVRHILRQLQKTSVMHQ